MALAGVGVDMLEVARMEKTIARRQSFVKRVFTEQERAYCDRMARPAQHYAARFAAREAVLKALGTGFSQGIGFKDVSVSRDEEGRPQVILAGRAREVADERGVLEVALSLSHTHDVAVASAVAVTEEVRPKPKEKTSSKDELRASFRAARSVIDELERVEVQPDQAQQLQLPQQPADEASLLSAGEQGEAGRGPSDELEQPAPEQLASDQPAGTNAVQGE